MSIQHITNLDEFKNILKSNPKAVVKFTADWCGPCKKVAPTYKRLAKDNVSIVFLEVDVDNAEDALLEYVQVSGIPRFVGYSNKKLAGDVTGADENRLKDMIEKL